jgi:general secretion pathway protein D
MSPRISASVAGITKTAPGRERELNPMMRRKRLACLGLAAAMSLPTGLSRFCTTFAAGATGDTQAKPSAADQLKQGIAQYKAGQFEESVTTLEQIDTKALSESDRSTMIATLTKADDAANQRKAARAEFQLGEEARKANRMVEAEGHYKAVVTNPSADAGTLDKAKSQLALVAAGEKNNQNSAKDTYARAVEEYKKGEWKTARADFTDAQQMGYTGGFLEASPADYLKKIDEGESKYAAKAAEQSKPADPTKVAADDQKPAEDLKTIDGRVAYQHGRDEYRAGNFDAARKDFAVARDAGYQPAFLEGLAPAEYLARMDQKQAEDAKAAAVAQSAGTAQVAAATASGSASASGTTVNLATDPATQPGINGFSAAGAVDLGAKAEASGDNQEAARQYKAALDADPNNALAAQGRDRVQAKLSTGGTLTQRQQEIEASRQAINFRLKTALENARADVGKNEFPAAKDEIENARAARAQDPGIFTDVELRAMDSQIAQAQNQKDTTERAYALTQAGANNAEIERLNKERAADQQRQRAATIASLIKISRTQQDQQNYTASLGVLDQILTLDPQNDYAIGVRQYVEDKAILQEQRKNRVKGDFNFEKQLNAADEMQIPYDDIFRFPDNWPDISELRDNEMKNAGLTKEDQTVQSLLDRRLPTVSFPQIPFSDAIGFLRDITGANILVNWKALEAQNIDKQTEVSANLHDVKFSKVLDIILQQAGGGKLSYTIDAGVITISTTDELNKAVATRVYDIRDLLIDPNFSPNQLLQSFSPTASGGGGGTGGGGGGGGTSSIFSGSSGTGTGTQGQQNLATQLTDIKTKIQTLVDFSTWKTNDPNGYGQIDDFNNSLIVTQTNEVHNKVANLLAQLRETQAVQVTVETRFLTIERHYMEDVGVDLGVTFNASSPNHFSPISIGNGLPNASGIGQQPSGTSTFTQAPNTGVPGGLGDLIGGGEGTAVSAAYGNFLDDLQVSLLVKAVEASKRSSIVHAPRVTLQSGQGATMVDETTLPYVSNLNATVSTSSSAITPTISTATDGVVLTIQRAVVSADHKYVTLDLFPRLDSFLGFRTFTFQSSSATTLILNGNGQTFTPTATLTIQLADEQVTAVATRVTVPDGGTLLLGGLTIAGEVELEAGPPGISKIPFLKRLLTNTSSASDEQVLIILVKPTILIDKEIEAKSFPMLSGSKNQ